MRQLFGTIIPALRLSAPLQIGPITFCQVGDLPNYDVQPPSDRSSIEQVASQIKDAFGNPLKSVGVSLVSEQQKAVAEAHGLERVARDMLAISVIVHGTLLNCYHQQRLSVCESDYFDALPIYFRSNGFVVRRPGHLGFHHGLSHYAPTLRTDIHEPDVSDFRVDNVLLDALAVLVQNVVNGTRVPECEQVFRALSVASNASRIIQAIDASYYDLAPRIVGWVSAFEVLLHPGVGEVGLSDVLGIAGQVAWLDDAKLRPGDVAEMAGQLTDLVPVTWRGKAHRPEQIPQNFYRRLYNLRNDLAHGNVIHPGRFAACEKWIGGARLDEATPLLFREVLLERLRALGMISRPVDGPIGAPGLANYVAARMDARHYHGALAAAVFGRHH